MKRFLCLILFATTSLCAVPSGFAQETVNYASVSGVVTDPQGAAIADARVSIRQTETNVTQRAASDDAGRFRFPYLRVGPYEIKVERDGFTAVTRTVTLTVGGAFDVPVSMPIAGVET